MLDSLLLPKDSTSVESDLRSLKLPDKPSVEGLVVGVPREYHRPNMDPEVVEVWTKVADLLENNGAQVSRLLSVNHVSGDSGN